MKYGITASTGHLGRLAVKDLAKLTDRNNIVAFARNMNKAKKVLPKGITVKPGNYDDESQLEKSFKGIDKLLFISSMPGSKVSRGQGQKNVVKASKADGIKYIAYTSFPHADKATSAFSADHRTTEKAIKDSGIKYSFIRDNWYLRDDIAVIKSASQGKPFVYSAGDGKVGWAPETEYAEGAVKVLVSNNPKPIYEFCGKSRSYKDLAKVVANVTGKNFKVMPVDDNKYKQLLQKSGMNSMIIGAIISIQDLIRKGELTENSNDLENVLGHPLMPLSKAVQNLLK